MADLKVPLSPRETEVLKLIVRGYSTNEISNELHISPRTVGVHRRNLLRKTETKNPAALIIWAFNSGFVEPPHHLT